MMVRFWHLFIQLLLIWLIFTLNSCSSTGLNRQLVSDSSSRIELQGVSILPPPGGDWYINKNESVSNKMLRAYNSVTFDKEPDSRTHTFFAACALRKYTSSYKTADDFLTIVKRIYSTKDKRYDIIYRTFDHCKNISPFCVKYELGYKDFKAKNKHPLIPFLTIETAGYIFPHPESPTIWVEIFYSERYAPSDQINYTAREESEIFLNSIRISPLE